MYPDEYLIGIQLFNAGDYFESHELWEAVWNATPAPERDFHKGLIQMAVALYHYFNGNMRGAAKLYHTSRAHLQPFRPRRQGLDLERLFADLDRCFADVLTADPDAPVAFDASLVPRLALEPPPVHWPAIPAWANEDDDKESES